MKPSALQPNTWLAALSQAGRLLLLALLCLGSPRLRADEPPNFAQALQERSVLEQEVASGPVREEVVPESQATLGLVIALAVVALVAAFRYASTLRKPFEPWLAKLRAADDVGAQLLAEPSIQMFLESLKGVPAEATAGTTGWAARARARARVQVPATERAVDAVQEFLKATPRDIAKLRTLLTEACRTPEESARRTCLQESLQQAAALRTRAEALEQLPLWQVGFALEGLFQRLSHKPGELSPSVQRTLAEGLDVLETLCRECVKPDLASEPPVRLLVVDDDPISRRAMTLALGKLFDEPSLAGDGPAALQLAQQHAYDVIFLDVEMPGMDGFELCRRIHETEPNRNTPVVFVTRHTDFNSRALFAASGGYSLLGKPFVVFELVLKSVTLVFRRRLTQDALPVGGSASATALPEDEEAALPLRD